MEYVLRGNRFMDVLTKDEGDRLLRVERGVMLWRHHEGPVVVAKTGPSFRA